MPLLLPHACMHAHAQVWFAMQGEMSATVVRHPAAWTALVPRIKADIVAGRDDADAILPNLKVGVSTNFNKLCACVLMDLVDPNTYLQKCVLSSRRAACMHACSKAARHRVVSRCALQPGV